MSKIGSHSIGTLITSIRSKVRLSIYGMWSNTKWLHPAARPYVNEEVSIASIPKAPINPWRKRPHKLVYDRNEFHMFRMPSEKQFLLSSFNYNDLFGARQNTNHSPHIRAQMNLDTNLVICMIGFTLTALFLEAKRSHNLVTLRANLVDSD